jgi:hypothetical protein
MFIIRKTFLFAIVLLLASCASSSKLLEKGDYDASIDKSIKKLMRSPDNSKEIKVLKKSFQLANDADLDKIEKLKLTGQPDIWRDIYESYTRLDNRQQRVRRLPDEVLDKINFQKHDYTSEQTAALKKAVAYNYEHAKVLLQTGNKQDAREAYRQLHFISDKMPYYKDVNQLMEKALASGTNYVLFRLENQSDVVLPKNYEEQILKMSLSSLNEQWITFDTYATEGSVYDFDIDLLLKEINVSPELIQQEKVTDTKEVEDGWEYVLDSHGNVMKDSLGNDIKKTKYTTIKAYVTKSHMNKKAQVKGTLDYYDNRTGQLIKTFPISTEFVFDYYYATYEGEREALSKESLELIKNKPIPFPTNPEIIFDTSDKLKDIAFNRIKRDKGLFFD